MIAAFHRNGNQLQLRGPQHPLHRAPRQPRARAVRESFSDSVAGGSPLMPPPRLVGRASWSSTPARLLLTDLPGRPGMTLEANLPPALRPRPAGERLRRHPGQPRREVRHRRVRAPTILPGWPSLRPRRRPSCACPSPPRSSTSAASCSATSTGSPACRPAYARRRADDRLGHFNVTQYDYSDDLQHDPRVHHLTRWRLERAPSPGRSRHPIRPIVYWLDPNIPARYRATVREAILAWNAAFERIGLQDAIAVRDAPRASTPTTSSSPTRGCGGSCRPASAPRPAAES